MVGNEAPPLNPSFAAARQPRDCDKSPPSKATPRSATTFAATHHLLKSLMQRHRRRALAQRWGRAMRCQRMFADGFGRLSQRDVTRQPNTPVLLKAFTQAAPPEMHDICNSRHRERRSPAELPLRDIIILLLGCVAGTESADGTQCGCY